MRAGRPCERYSKAGRPGGFTLVDMLLALVIVGASLGAVYGVFQAGLAAWNKATAEMELSFDGTYLIGLLEGDLRGAAFIEREQLEQSGDGETDAAFRGDEETVEFFTNTSRPGQVVWPTHHLRYYFEKDPAETWGSVRVRSLPTAGAVPLVEEASDEVLVDHVRQIRFRYMKEGRWQDQWNGDDLPAAVEISLEMESAGRRISRSFKTVVDVPAWRSVETSSRRGNL